MSAHSVWTVARAAGCRFAAVGLAGAVAAALVQLAAVPLAAGAPAALAAVAAAQAGGQPPGAAARLGAVAILADIRGGGGPLAADPETGTVYVADTFGPSLQLVSELTGQATGAIALPGVASAVGVDPATGTIYAVTPDAIAVISGQSEKVTATIADALSPSQIAVDPATGTIYVTNTGSDTITVIDGSTDAVTTTVSIGHPLSAIAADPVTGTIYAASGDGTVSVIDAATNAVTATISVGTGQDAITVNPRTDTVYAGSGEAIAVISGATNAVTATVKAGAAGLAADPRTDTIYITGPGGGTFALDGRTSTVVAEVAPAPPVFPPGQGPEIASGAGLAVNPAAGIIYSVYSVYEEFGPVSHLQVIGSCASDVAISPGTACAKVAAGFQPSAVSFPGPARGAVLGALNCGAACSQAALTATADGGSHWSFLPVPPSPALGEVPSATRVLFTSPGDGWLYGALHTSDGGATWQQQAPVPRGRATLMAATATTIYAAAKLPGSHIDGLFTRPVGGTAWTRVPGITANVTGLAVSGRSVWLTSTTHLWATTDGRHWHRYPARCPGTRYRLTAVTAASPSHVAFLCARSGGSPLVPKEVLTSADGGRTVHLAGRAPAAGTPEGFASLPGNPAVITIAAARTDPGALWIYRSANHGRTWTTQTLRLNGIDEFSSLTYTSRTAGWITLTGPAGGSENTLLHTTDGGRTWHKTTP